MQADNTADGVLAPSGKGAADENFPVGSILIARRLRPHVARFYAFARGTDDIADAPHLTPEEKVVRLDACGAALRGEAAGPEMALRLRESLAETGVPVKHPLDLLVAFRQDAVKGRYADWADLMDYCAHSADPVGAYLLDLHGEDASAKPASNALCTVLQVVNHLQDLKDDLRTLDRCYLPQDWLAEEGAVTEDVLADAASPALRRVIDRMLAECAPMLDAADRLPPLLKSRRLAAEARVICVLARRLAGRLSRQDPIAGRVKLSKLDFAVAALRGLSVLLNPLRGLS